MADAYFGELRLLPYTFTPQAWEPCDGRLLPISGYEALFAVIGTCFGGNGSTNFGLPDLRGLAVAGAGHHPGSDFDPAFSYTYGSMTVHLNSTTVPPHNHTLNARQAPQSIRSTTPAGNLLTGIAYRPDGGPPIPTANPYTETSTSLTHLHPETLTTAPGNAGGHENRQPALALEWFICVDGAWPARP